MNELRAFSTDHLLRRVAAARVAGDPERARREWETCVLRGTRRVRSAVATFRTSSGDRIPLADRDEVVYDALARACRRMLHTLESLDERSFNAALVTCAQNACRDHFRSIGRHARHVAGSLDEPAGEDGDGGRYDGALAREARMRQLDDDAALEAADRIARAIPLIKSERQREAIRLREAGCEYEEIADRLGTSRDNAYQLYCRGLRDLRGLMES